MTTTVNVRARAWGASVETNGETVELGPHQDHSFHIQEGESATFTVKHGEKPVEEAEPEATSAVSDAAPLAQPPVGNETGADETAMSTDQPTRGGRSGSGR